MVPSFEIGDERDELAIDQADALDAAPEAADGLVAPDTFRRLGEHPDAIALGGEDANERPGRHHREHLDRNAALAGERLAGEIVGRRRCAG